MMKKILGILCVCFALFSGAMCGITTNLSRARGRVSLGGAEEISQSSSSYYTITDWADSDRVVLLKGEGINVDDEYLSEDNELWRIVEVDNKNKKGKAEYIGKEQLPKYDVKRKVSAPVAEAASRKKVGVYHTHNDESYFTPDGTDSVYGKGGIHDVGKSFVNNLESLGFDVVYREDLHLPHNSGAYTRSQVTAQAILDTGNIDALFDVHRDSTPRKYYITNVDGQEMTKVRMVVGSANSNFAENKEFAYAIKSYADSVYPGLIKDIYMGRGNYNQQLLSRGILFEFGSENVEKELCLKSTEPLAKVLDVVMYGTSGANVRSVADVSGSNEGETAVVTGIVYKQSTASVSFIWILLGSIAFYFVVLGIVCIFSKTARYKTARFFKELVQFKGKK